MVDDRFVQCEASNLVLPGLGRRRFIQGGAAIIVSTALPSKAEASYAEIAYAVAKFVGLQVAAWAIKKTLDAAWDYATRKISAFAIESTGTTLRPLNASGTIVDIELKAIRSALTEEAKRQLSRIKVESHQFANGRHVIPNAFFSALRQNDVALSDIFTFWGAPTTEALKRELPNGGELAGQWWINHDKGKVRYVMIRSYGNGQAQFLAYRNETAGIAEKVVHGAEPTRDRMKTLVHEPWNFVLRPEERPSYD